MAAKMTAKLGKCPKTNHSHIDHMHFSKIKEFCANRTIIGYLFQVDPKMAANPGKWS